MKLTGNAMLTLHFSNRLETLTGRLFEQLDRRQPDVFARDEIIVPSMALRRHLSIRRASTTGISANLQFDFLARWLWRQIARVVPDVAEESPFSAFRLAWQVLAAFEQEELLANHPRLSIYLEGADAVMRYELALRLGTLLGNGAQLWLDMQTKFDLWQAEAKLHDELGQMKRLESVAMA